MAKTFLVQYNPDLNASLEAPIRKGQIVHAEEKGIDYVGIVTEVLPTGFWFEMTVLAGKHDVGRMIELHRSSIVAIMHCQSSTINQVQF